MSKTLNITQEIIAIIDWEKLAKDLIKEFDIEIPEDDLISFCSENEPKYLAIEDYGQEIEETDVNDLTGDETSGTL